jgi:sulfonate transport system substrate-binding protein
LSKPSERIVTVISRISAIAVALALAAFSASLTATPTQAADNVVRIGFQKYGKLALLKARGTLEKRLEPIGFNVTWTEFPAGPQLLEGLNAGAIDFGNTGEAPPIFAQAAGAPLLYVAYEPPAPRGEAILVPKDNAIKTVADLKGKKVALNKGSNVHFLLVKALEKAGISYADIQPVFLSPSDARAAFEKGAVDAWAIWDPYLAAAEAATGAKTLANAEGRVFNHQFYLSSKTFAGPNPQIIQILISELAGVDAWVKADIKTAAALLSKSTGLSIQTVEVALDRQSYGIRPVGKEAVAAQQDIADTFYKLGLLPKPLVIADAVWKTGS